jgi:hypothetical protein
MSRAVRADAVSAVKGARAVAREGRSASPRQQRNERTRLLSLSATPASAVQAAARGGGWSMWTHGLSRQPEEVGWGSGRRDSEFYKTTTVVKQLAVGDVSLSVVNVNRSLFETIVRELIVDGASS